MSVLYSPQGLWWRCYSIFAKVETRKAAAHLQRPTLVGIKIILVSGVCVQVQDYSSLISCIFQKLPNWNIIKNKTKLLCSLRQMLGSVLNHTEQILLDRILLKRLQGSMERIDTQNMLYIHLPSALFNLPVSRPPRNFRRWYRDSLLQVKGEIKCSISASRAQRCWCCLQTRLTLGFFLFLLHNKSFFWIFLSRTLVFKTSMISSHVWWESWDRLQRRRSSWMLLLH